MQRTEFLELPYAATVEADGLIAWCDLTDPSGGPRVKVSPASALSGAGATTAADVALVDAGGLYTAVQVEAALAEVMTTLVAAVATILSTAAVQELARDAVGSALIESTGIDIAVNDAGDQITFSVANLLASMIAATPGGTLAGTLVSTQLAELEAEKAPLVHTHAWEVTTTVPLPFAFQAPVDGELGLEFRVKRAGVIPNVYATTTGNPSGAALRADVHKNGTTIFTDQTARPNVADGTDSDMTATPAVTAVAAGDLLQVQIDTAAGATGVVVVIEWQETFTS